MKTLKLLLLFCVLTVTCYAGTVSLINQPLASYLLNDSFDNALSAGAVNGTAAVPGPGGTRTVVDTHASVELVSNGGFTSATTGWVGTACTIASVAGGQSGNCLEATVSSGTAQKITQTVSGTVVGKSYNLSIYIKSGTSGDGDSYRLRIRDSGDTTTVAETSVYTTTSDWVQKTLSFTATGTSHILQIRKESATAGTMLFDTVSIMASSGLLSIASGKLTFDGGASSWGDPGVWWSTAITRTAGRIALMQFNSSDVTNSIEFGFDSNTSGNIVGSGARIASDTIKPYDGSTAGPTVFIPVDSTDYRKAIVLRAGGAYYFMKGGTLTNWTLLWANTTNATTPLYLGISGYDLASTRDYVRVPSQLWLPSPTVSDGFTGDNGTLLGLYTPSELLSNTGFETPGTGGNDTFDVWQEVRQGSTNTIATWAGPHSGTTNALVGWGLGEEFHPNLFQGPISVTPGVQYTLSFWTHSMNDYEGYYFVLNHDTGATVAYGFTGIGGVGWTQFTTTFTPSTATSVDVYLTSDWNEPEGCMVFYDDVSLKQTTATYHLTNGAGHAETTGLGSGGNGLAWSAPSTWTIIGNKAANASAGATDYIATTQANKADVWVSADVTRSSANVGIAMNCDNATNPQNQVEIYHDGTYLYVMKCLSGSCSQVSKVAATYSAGASTRGSKMGTTYAAYYNNVLIAGGITSITDVGIISNTRHGIYSENSGNRIDNFVVRPTGTGGEYAILDSF